MIGNISLGTSFFHCISYCLEDKRTLTEEQKIKKSLEDGLQHKDRAEVLAYNKCFGDKYELAEQFKEVARLSRRVEKPVLHLSLSLRPGEQLNGNQLIEAAQEMAKEFGVADNQYLIIQHKDTNKQHIHLVANRVGYQGKAASTSNNYLKMDRLCRRLEKQYNLQEVLSAKRFLPKEQKLIPRHDTRKEKIKNDIKQSLNGAFSYDEFAQKLQALGYQIVKGRGITFIDNKKVKVKGSELGYSLHTIEKLLQQKQEKKLKPENLSGAAKRKEKETATIPQKEVAATGFKHKKVITAYEQNLLPENSVLEELSKGLGGILSDLLKPEYADQSISPELLHKAKIKRKRKRPKV
jgi:hypothetical protein